MNEQKLKALAALISSPNTKEAAKIAGIADSTMRRYLKDEEFRNEYQKACSELVANACTQAQQSLSTAIATLWKVCSNENEAGQTRVGAARALLEYGIKLTECADFEQRISALEERVKEPE